MSLMGDFLWLSCYLAHLDLLTSVWSLQKENGLYRKEGLFSFGSSNHLPSDPSLRLDRTLQAARKLRERHKSQSSRTVTAVATLLGTVGGHLCAGAKCGNLRLLWSFPNAGLSCWYWGRGSHMVCPDSCGDSTKPHWCATGSPHFTAHL